MMSKAGLSLTALPSTTRIGLLSFLKGPGQGLPSVPEIPIQGRGVGEVIFTRHIWEPGGQNEITTAGKGFKSV